MDKTRPARSRPAVRSEALEWGDIHTGTRDDLIAAGLLREEWIPIKTRKNGSVETVTEDGRWVRVYAKGPRLEVRIEASPAERARREELREKQVAEQRARVAHLLPCLLERAHSVYFAMRARYPAVEVSGPIYEFGHDGVLRQTLTFHGALDQLIAYGLLTPAMARSFQESWRDGRRGSRAFRTTPLGCNFTLWAHEERGFCLHIYSAVKPSGPDHLPVDDARRELARIFAASPARHAPRAKDSKQ